MRLRFALSGVIFSLMLLWTQALPAQSLKIITTNFPLYDFTRQIAGDKAEVRLLLPPGIEVHSYRPTPGDILQINRADIFIYISATMEPWAHDVLAGLDNRQVLAVEAAQGLISDLSGAAGTNHENKKTHAHGAEDPHFWLNPILAQKAVDRIAGALSRQDPGNQEYYAQRARSYNQSLQKLDADIRAVLLHCRLHTVIFGGHAAFGYFGREYGLTFLTPYQGFSPDAEPSPKSLAELIGHMRRLNAGVVYYEELIQPKIAQIIARETNAKLLLLHGAHNLSKTERSQGATYLTLMHQNLEKLKQGLDYQP